MSHSSIDRVPVEIWEKVLHHATVPPLLPFTEDGALSPSLNDNLLLFDNRCRSFNMYRDQTQVIVERLRLVCRLWAELLRQRAKELCLTNFGWY